MSKVTSMFAAAARAAAVSLRYFCDRCNAETTWRFAGEDKLHEYYRCEKCGQRKGWTVR